MALLHVSHIQRVAFVGADEDLKLGMDAFFSHLILDVDQAGKLKFTSLLTARRARSNEVRGWMVSVKGVRTGWDNRIRYERGMEMRRASGMTGAISSERTCPLIAGLSSRPAMLVTAGSGVCKPGASCAPLGLGHCEA